MVQAHIRGWAGEGDAQKPVGEGRCRLSVHRPLGGVSRTRPFTPTFRLRPTLERLPLEGHGPRRRFTLVPARMPSATGTPFTRSVHSVQGKPRHNRENARGTGEETGMHASIGEGLRRLSVHRPLGGVSRTRPFTPTFRLRPTLERLPLEGHGPRRRFTLVPARMPSATGTPFTRSVHSVQKKPIHNRAGKGEQQRECHHTPETRCKPGHILE